ncbi:DUF1885 family protein [Salirhabdus salicampi]|uniref:DUF1885 family protein n=1 Tax=Salirhabdus salicampi TaxID=476102 RepID=UPI0020C4ABB4|nr:DUF1885 family protein [Salirhabdus salicampi]MCP8616068.1 DUF1885 family protein [Salirhabdus salicampi]
MGRSTYVYPKNPITLQDIQDQLQYYQEITTKTGEQLNWNYEQQAFPYDIQLKEYEGHQYLLLKGTLDRYNSILIGVIDQPSQNAVQITLPSSAEHGDKGKANELAKFFAKKFNGTLQLFNGRLIQ